MASLTSHRTRLARKNRFRIRPMRPIPAWAADNVPIIIKARCRWGAAPKQKNGRYEEREVGNLSQRKGKKTIRPKGWGRARIRGTDLQQSRDDPDGNEHRVKH